MKIFVHAQKNWVKKEGKPAGTINFEIVMEAYTDTIITLHQIKLHGLPSVSRKNELNSCQLQVRWKDGKEVHSPVFPHSNQPTWEQFPEVVAPDITVKVSVITNKKFPLTLIVNISFDLRNWWKSTLNSKFSTRVQNWSSFQEIMFAFFFPI